MMPFKLTRIAGLALACAVALPGLARASNYELDEIPQAIPSAEAAKLKAAGVPTTFALLEKGAAAKDRKALAKQTKISEKTLESWVKMADLMRVKGIGPEAAKILSAAGTGTVATLQKADAAKLSEEISKVNTKQKLSENPPNQENVQAWIEQAQTLPIVLK